MTPHKRARLAGITLEKMAAFFGSQLPLTTAKRWAKNRPDVFDACARHAAQQQTGGSIMKLHFIHHAEGVRVIVLDDHGQPSSDHISLTFATAAESYAWFDDVTDGHTLPQTAAMDALRDPAVEAV